MTRASCREREYGMHVQPVRRRAACSALPSSSPLARNAGCRACRKHQTVPAALACRTAPSSSARVSAGGLVRRATHRETSTESHQRVPSALAGYPLVHSPAPCSEVEPRYTPTCSRRAWNLDSDERADVGTSQCGLPWFALGDAAACPP